MSRAVSPSEREKIVARLQDNLAARREILFAYLHGSFLEGRSGSAR